MKTLHLMRHAKSTWDNPQATDRLRELNSRGRKAAARMGEALAELIEPIAINASPARRAQQTLEGLCSTWPALAALEHVTEEDLYTFDSAAVIDWIREQGDERSTLFLLGHNPAYTELVNTLTRRNAIDNLPTAGYVQLSLEIDSWDQVLDCAAVLEHVLLPRQLE